MCAVIVLGSTRRAHLEEEVAARECCRPSHAARAPGRQRGRRHRKIESQLYTMILCSPCTDLLCRECVGTSCNCLAAATGGAWRMISASPCLYDAVYPSGQERHELHRTISRRSTSTRRPRALAACRTAARAAAAPPRRGGRWTAGCAQHWLTSDDRKRIRPEAVLKW